MAGDPDLLFPAYLPTTNPNRRENLNPVTVNNNKNHCILYRYVRKCLESEIKTGYITIFLSFASRYHISMKSGSTGTRGTEGSDTQNERSDNLSESMAQRTASFSRFSFLIHKDLGVTSVVTGSRGTSTTGCKQRQQPQLRSGGLWLAMIRLSPCFDLRDVVLCLVDMHSSLQVYLCTYDVVFQLCKSYSFIGQTDLETELG